MSTSARTAALVAGALAWAAPALAERPLSAIDWLSDSVAATGPRRPPPTITPVPGAEPITVMPLGTTLLDAVGLLPPQVSGLPRTFWGPGETQAIARAVRAERVDTLPAVQALLVKLLLAELDPPTGGGPDGQLLLARLDKLLDLGALDQAQALVERAGPTAPSLFRRWFDISLLTGQEDRACSAMRANPGIAPTFPARIFCLARGGDWNAAALTLETGLALGFVKPEEDALLARFLDPALAEESEALRLPTRPSPLIFRMREAIGEPLSTTTLPVAFARADMRPTAGWKARIEAAERLARTGALAPNELLGVWTERKPAASGGLWDRVAALQAFDLAILSGEPDAVTETLAPAWKAMASAELEVPFAQLYGPQLVRMNLPGATGALAFRIGLLSDEYEALAQGREPQTNEEAFLIGIARGGDLQGVPPLGSLAAALRDGFDRPGLGTGPSRLIKEGRLGEAVLAAIDLLTDGAQGDILDVTRGLGLLRRLGLEDAARKSALQLMLLERRG
ncbi:HAMP domain-containing protein [Rhodovulum sulfidophilum]|uniref:hypothetical protein n=1 Tax=Rhodovulum sulfidophilum TaxID=35806 RepID=UPI0005A7F3D6|nr:hypothetical protein [Rhodovulum sulfidophilum]ANB34926.1 hypothetical protein A6W98_13135 [Rhodovulum sulfidophilum DSM 1374]ANB38748.1 hypothetical protein A6024_13000 [Rhodovulum sulfidophilum]MCW2302252.1 HAMP domain-containing protein [Rhodovulum sulfidophilum]